MEKGRRRGRVRVVDQRYDMETARFAIPMIAKTVVPSDKSWGKRHGTARAVKLHVIQIFFFHEGLIFKVGSSLAPAPHTQSLHASLGLTVTNQKDSDHNQREDRACESLRHLRKGRF